MNYRYLLSKLWCRDFRLFRRDHNVQDRSLASRWAPLPLPHETDDLTHHRSCLYSDGLVMTSSDVSFPPRLSVVDGMLQVSRLLCQGLLDGR